MKDERAYLRETADGLLVGAHNLIVEASHRLHAADELQDAQEMANEALKDLTQARAFIEADREEWE